MREALRADAAQSKMTWEFLCEVQASEGERTGARRASCARHSWRRYRWCAEWSSGESAQHRGDRRWVDQKAGWIDASGHATQDRKSTRLNSSDVSNSYAVYCLKK